jgi:hypothetical protein
MKVGVQFEAQTASSTDRFTPEKHLQVCIGGIVELKRQSGHKGEKKNLFPRCESKPDSLVVHSVA